MKDGDFCGGESLWNINVRSFLLSYNLLQGEENVLSILSCPDIRLPKNSLLELEVFNMGTGGSFLSGAL